MSLPQAKAKAQAKGLVAAVAIKQAKDQEAAVAEASKKAEAAAAAEAEAQVAAEAASREAAAARKRADSEASTLAELKRKASALEKDAKAAGATIPDLDKPEPKKTAKKAKKSGGGSKKRKSEAISEEEPAAEAADGDMDMTAVNKLTADKLKKELLAPKSRPQPIAASPAVPQDLPPALAPSGIGVAPKWHKSDTRVAPTWQWPQSNTNLWN